MHNLSVIEQDLELSSEDKETSNHISSVKRIEGTNNEQKNRHAQGGNRSCLNRLAVQRAGLTAKPVATQLCPSKLAHEEKDLDAPTPPNFPKDSASIVCSLCEKLVSFALSIPLIDMQSPTRCSGDAALARQIAMYLAHTTFSLSMTEIGHQFRRDRSTVSHACVVIEDRRDELSFDLTVCQLEALLCDARSAMAACLDQAVFPTKPPEVEKPSRPKLCDKLLPVRRLKR